MYFHSCSYIRAFMLHPREVGMCVSRKYLYPSHGRSLEISRKVGSGGEGVETKNLPCRSYGYFLEPHK